MAAEGTVPAAWALLESETVNNPSSSLKHITSTVENHEHIVARSIGVVL